MIWLLIRQYRAWRIWWEEFVFIVPWFVAVKQPSGVGAYGWLATKLSLSLVIKVLQIYLHVFIEFCFCIKILLVWLRDFPTECGVKVLKYVRTGRRCAGDCDPRIRRMVQADARGFCSSFSSATFRYGSWSVQVDCNSFIISWNVWPIAQAGSQWNYKHVGMYLYAGQVATCSRLTRGLILQPIHAEAPLEDCHLTFSNCLISCSFVCRWNVGCNRRRFRHGQCELRYMDVLSTESVNLVIL